MAIQLKVVNKKTLNDINKQLAALQGLMDACNQAEQAGIPGIDVVRENCVDVQNRLNKFKAVYFPMET